MDFHLQDGYILYDNYLASLLNAEFEMEFLRLSFSGKVHGVPKLLYLNAKSGHLLTPVAPVKPMSTSLAPFWERWIAHLCNLIDSWLLCILAILF